MRHKVEFTTKTLKSDNISCHVIHHHQNNILITWADTPNGQTAPLGRHPPSRHPRQTTLQADIPPWADPPADTPPVQPPPWADTPGQTSPPNGHCSGRYASYLNAFLLREAFMGITFTGHVFDFPFLTCPYVY